MKLNDIKMIVTVLLLGLSLFTALILESRMNTGYAIQLAIILIGAILMACALFGLWIEAEWSYPFTLIVFALSLANLVWAFTSTKAFLPFTFGLLISVAGIVMCLASTGAYSLEELETYEINKKRKK
ncbi:Uncharacterised protein [uncultured archaeon]|nr:Uncharacterised protein [uncultured archaeon]